MNENFFFFSFSIYLRKKLDEKRRINTENCIFIISKILKIFRTNNKISF